METDDQLIMESADSSVVSDYFGTGTGPAPRTESGTTQSSAAATSAPANWYPDPYQQGYLRWFDGQQWTGHVSGPAPSWATPPRNRRMEALLPVNRSALSIAAGYAGLFSILLIFAPLALVLGVFALRDLSTKPDVGGRGRAWFGVIAGVLGTFGLLAVLTS